MKKIIKKFIEALASEIKRQLLSADMSVSILRMEPGDTIVLNTKMRISDHAWQNIVDSMKNSFPDNKVILLEEDIVLSIVRNSQ